MGVKRPFDIEYFQELPFKQARQVDYSNKSTQFGGLYQTYQEPVLAVDHGGSIVNSQKSEKLEKNSVDEVANLVKDVEFSDLLSSVTSNSSDGDILSGIADYLSDSPENSRFDYPQRLEPFDDAYFLYLDGSPRRKIPLGPNHQTSIPVWGGHFNKDWLEQGDSSTSSSLSHDSYVAEEKFMGTCIMPMPDIESSQDDSNDAGSGVTDCSCLDEGSIRCVRQHIIEARVKLEKSLGHKKFNNLGFRDMGEDVAHKWSEEEKRVFHAVVYSNPASLGHNFWKHLSQVFPTRSTKEIVSYYFNVFMLQRRAAQNRSRFLDIDSDDDELQGIHRRSYKAQVLDEDSDSDAESIDEYDNADHGEDAFVEDDDHEDDKDDDSAGAGDIGDINGDGSGEDSGIDNVSETLEAKSLDGSQIDAVANRADYGGGSVVEDFTFQDGSCTSFEFQADEFGCCDPVEMGSALQMTGVRSNDGGCLSGEGNGYSDGMDHMYAMDPCDGRYAVPMKGVDLLPTCNIIEEIFGQGTFSDYTMK